VHFSQKQQDGSEPIFFGI